MSNQAIYISGNRKFYLNEVSGSLILNNLNFNTNSNVEIVAPVSGMYGTGNLLNALNVRGFASVGADLSSLTGIFNTGAVGLSGISPAQFSAGNMLIGSNEGGAYLGRVGVRENSWQVLSGTEGVNWTARMTDSNRNWYSIAMSSDGRIQTAVVYGGINGYVYTSYDYGVTWTARGSNRNWYSIAMSSDGRIQTAVVNNGDQIYTSYDYGVTWKARGSNRDWIGIAMSSDGRIQTAVAINDQIYTSYDYGVTWTARDSNRQWLGIAMSSDGRIQTATFYGGQIYTSYDYGVTWTARDSNRQWYRIAMSSDGRIQTATVNNVHVYTSYDYGATWTARMTDSSRLWRGIAMSSDGRIQTAVVLGGQIYTSYDYGVTWTARKSRQWWGIAMSSDGRVQTAVAVNDQIYTSYAATVTPNPINVLGSITSYDNIIANNLVYNTGNQTISGIKTFATEINVSGKIINGLMADIFPVSETKRRYPPEGLVTTNSTLAAQSGFFQYFPFFIKKDAVNPKICVEVTTQNTATPIRYGIYSANNGFEGAKLFFSGSINCQNTNGVYTDDINITLPKGPYIIATANTGVSTASACAFRMMASNSVRSLFGDPTGNTTLFGGALGTTVHYYETGINLFSTIGSGIYGSSPVSPVPALIY